MTVLIIDDQVEVVNGIRSGVDWRRLQVDTVLQAHSGMEAREIILSQAVDVLLCDIEMPMGNGLDLFSWVRESKLNLKCIFLTSHADFAYAQTAVRLGSFDYLLQPAPYRVIEQVLGKAIEQIRMDESQRQAYEYGLSLQGKEEAVQNGFLRDFLRGLQVDARKAAKSLRDSGVAVDADSLCRVCILHVLHKNNVSCAFEPELEQYALRNMLLEVLEPAADSLLFFQLDSSHYGVLLTGGPDMQGAPPISLLESFIRLTEQYLQYRVAFYLSEPVPFHQIPREREALTGLEENNVAEHSAVFRLGTPKKDPSYRAPELDRWEELLRLGDVRAVQEQIMAYLQEQEEGNAMGLAFLARFQQDFIQMFFSVIRQYQLKAHEVFEREYDYNALTKASGSLQKMRDLVAFALRYIAEKSGASLEGESQARKAVEFIRANLDRNITRGEIAETVYLNPEYLSRLFKKETGYSLSDFILREKMNTVLPLVRDTALPISLIATKVGYHNFSHFAQSFKKVFGSSPSEVRQTRLKEVE